GRHYGIDYGTPIGTPITATTGGRLSSFWNEGGGKIAKLVTGQLRQFFMHMQTVAPNGSVKAGDVIGRSGKSGRWTTGPHVHWQAQKGTDALNRNTIDPRKVIGHANGGIFKIGRASGRESGGSATGVQTCARPICQLRQFFMHMQTVAPTGSVKAGDVIGRSGNSGRWTTGPHVHWQAQKGTDALNRNTIAPRKVIGHANGGIFSNQHIANFAEEGPEAIIPLSAKRRGRANSLYDSVGKAIGRDDGQQFRTMIDNQQKQIERMDKTINVLLGIEDKTGFDPGKAKKSIDRHIDDRAIIY